MQVDQATQQAEAIFHFSEEVERRLAEHGIAGIADFFRLHRQLCQALGGLDSRDLDRAAVEARLLVRSLDRIRARLAGLSALKASLGVPH